MKRRLVVAFVVLISLVACSSPASVAEGPKPPKTGVVEVTGWTEKDDMGYREIVVNGRHCIEHQMWPGSTSATYAISCDWTPR